MKIKLTLEYDGRAFHGWQMQGDLPTVQRELRQAMGIYLRSVSKRIGASVSEPPPLITGSGRTDAGVHARGQVASFTWPAELPWEQERFVRSINGITVPSLAILSAEPAPDTFDARFSPHLKCYVYRILLRQSGGRGLHHGKVWQIPRSLDVPAMIAGAQAFKGTYDFHAFRAADCMSKTTIRTVHLSEISRPSKEELRYVIHGTGFLKQMVRIIVGTLVDVGLGKTDSNEISSIIASGERAAAGDTAPAYGLSLEWVKYSEDR